MKSIAELEAIRQKTISRVILTHESDGIRVSVGLATCGIAAGANPVMAAFKEEVAKAELKNINVAQTGCIGMCRYEPIVEVTAANKDKVTYVHVKPEMVARIVKEHLIEGNPVAEYTIGAAEK